jgi:hypothetical protein
MKIVKGLEPLAGEDIPAANLPDGEDKEDDADIIEESEDNIPTEQEEPSKEDE